MNPGETKMIKEKHEAIKPATSEQPSNFIGAHGDNFKPTTEPVMTILKGVKTYKIVRYCANCRKIIRP